MAISQWAKVIAFLESGYQNYSSKGLTFQAPNCVSTSVILMMFTIVDVFSYFFGLIWCVLNKTNTFQNVFLTLVL